MNILISDPTQHICRQLATIQSPHHPAVFIALEYGKPPVICLLNGQDRELTGQELASTLLEWEFLSQLRESERVLV